MERNYVTVTLFIHRDQLMSSTNVERRTVRPNFSLNFPFYRVTLCIAVMECSCGCQSDCENVLYLLLCVRSTIGTSPSLSSNHRNHLAPTTTTTV